ncbi:MAG: hypothetical protein ACLFV3_13025 [Phycisphaeraceae bacterium]
MQKTNQQKPSQPPSQDAGGKITNRREYFNVLEAAGRGNPAAQQRLREHVADGGRPPAI